MPPLIRGELNLVEKGKRVRKEKGNGGGITTGRNKLTGDHQLKIDSITELN